MSEVLTEREGAVLTITLNRPEVFNALNAALHARLRSAPEEAGERDVRAVVITGAGRGFCCCQGLTEFQDGSISVREALKQTYHPNIRLIRALEKPVIAAVNGPCAGAGLSLAAACDLRIASDAASFVPGFIGIGLIPDSGARGSFTGCSVRAGVRLDDDQQAPDRRGSPLLGARRGGRRG